MSSNRAGHAASIVVHRIRQNWRWSQAHSWAHLIEEHDLNPLVRGRRAIRKTWWRLTQRAALDPEPVVDGDRRPEPVHELHAQQFAVFAGEDWSV